MHSFSESCTYIYIVAYEYGNYVNKENLIFKVLSIETILRLDNCSTIELTLKELFNKYGCKQIGRGHRWQSTSLSSDTQH